MIGAGLEANLVLRSWWSRLRGATLTTKAQAPLVVTAGVALRAARMLH